MSELEIKKNVVLRIIRTFIGNSIPETNLGTLELESGPELNRLAVFELTFLCISLYFDSKHVKFPGALRGLVSLYVRRVPLYFRSKRAKFSGAFRAPHSLHVFVFSSKI